MEKNIHEVLISNWTTVVIRARIEAIKGGGEVKYGGGKKSTWGREIEREKEEHQECHHGNNIVSYNIICNYNRYMNSQRNSLLVFPIVECLFLVVYLYLSCVNCYCRVSR